ncbi:hypothetical protein [uncultured Spirosoma sp.]|uniref:hypothetical protein n=1 Tax=uncultured Spirosoma sp. TaxID=278208 RepID=UPI0025907E9E|nr:hypothetical protein [uncultured Spirosoma sp.]
MIFFNARDIQDTPKVTVHRTGRMGFSRSAEKKLMLSTDKSVLIGLLDEPGNGQVLVLKMADTKQPEAFAVNKSGPYYYANTRNLFDLLGENYEDSKLIYDLIPDTADGQPIFKLKRRSIERKK